jgi:hypothetical protein
VKAGEFRKDVPPAELAAYCLGALSGVMPKAPKPVVRRLVTVVLAGIASCQETPAKRRRTREPKGIDP